MLQRTISHHPIVAMFLKLTDYNNSLPKAVQLNFGSIGQIHRKRMTDHYFLRNEVEERATS
jgi:hypothetical protein